MPPLENCEKHRKSSLSSGKFLQLVLLSLKVPMSAQNQCGFLTNTLYYEAETGEQARLSIERYNIAITVRQWGRERRTIRKELLSSGSYKYQAAIGEKETFMTYFSSGGKTATYPSVMHKVPGIAFGSFFPQEKKQADHSTEKYEQ